MDKVYLLFGITDEGFTDVIGVFATEEAAKQDKTRFESDEEAEGYDGTNFWVEGREIIR